MPRATRTIAEFARLLKGDNIIVTIYGPSVDHVNAEKVSGPRILIGRAVDVVPASGGETWFLPGDWPDKEPDGFERYMQRVYSGRARVLAVGPDVPHGINVVTYKRERDIAKLSKSRSEAGDAGELLDDGKPLVTAAHLAWLLGAKAVKFVTGGRDAEQKPAAESLFRQLSEREPAPSEDHEPQ